MDAVVNQKRCASSSYSGGGEAHPEDILRDLQSEDEKIHRKAIISRGKTRDRARVPSGTENGGIPGLLMTK